MPDREHEYSVQVVWTGNTGSGTADIRGYGREHLISAPGKNPIAGSSDPSFRGDPSRWNPEELLVASLSACHKLWYLGLCAGSGVVVTSYEDQAEGGMRERPDGAGEFVRVVLRPVVTITGGSDPTEARRLHQRAHEMCFIARSVNFSVSVEPVVQRGSSTAI